METEENNSELFIMNLKVIGGFAVPLNYFKILEERLQIISETPNFTIPEINNFAVPNGYFDTLEANILMLVLPEEAQIIPLYKRGFVKNLLAVAATLLLFSMLYLFMNRPASHTGNMAGIHKLSTQEIIEHLSSEGYNLELLCDAGWCNDLNKLNKKENTDVENYLLEHGEEDFLSDEL